MSAGCGASGEVAAPTGPPAERRGEAALDRMFAVEDVRARLLAASDLYGLRRAIPALEQLSAARAGWGALAPTVGSEDRRLGREIDRGLALAEERMRRGARPEYVREGLDPLTAQLLDGALAVLVGRAARTDPGAQAETLSRLTAAFEARYRSGPEVTPAYEPTAYHAYGLFARAQVLARGLSEVLGPERETVVISLQSVRAEAYPTGLAPRPPTGAMVGDPPKVVGPPPSTVRVARLAEGARAALRRRFRL